MPKKVTNATYSDILSAVLLPFHLGKTMQTIATERLTRSYLQKLDWQNYLATAVAILIATISFLWMLLHIGGSNTVTFFSDSMYPVASWIGAFWAASTAYRGRYGPLRLEPRHQLAWLLISLGMFADGLGGAYYAYLEHIGQFNPEPSLSDIGFTLFYPLAFIGLLLLPTEPKTQRFRIRIALDSSISTLCILGVSWYFFIGPSFVLQSDAHASAATLITALSYPFWDMLLILAIILLVWRRAEPILHPSLFITVAGIISITWADTSYAYFNALGTYNTGVPYIDTFWFIGSLLIGLSALYQYLALARRAYNERTNPQQATGSLTSPYLSGEQTFSIGHIHDRDEKRHRRSLFLQSFLIYLPLSILLGFTLYSELTQHNAVSIFLVVLTMIAGVLITARYLFATQQNETLLRERERQREESERLRLMAAQLNEILELDPLLEHIVTMATSALGFDAALLLLIEGHEQPQDRRYGLLVHAATAHPSKTTTWRFQETDTSHTSALSGKEVEVSWAAQDTVLPEEVRAWQQQQHIRATLFVPLMYHGRLQGSLGFSSQSSQFFNQHDRRLAEAFTEQVATAIEHAHLYQEAREQELFAKAMANIAARLNAAVAAPSEIHELICTEGAMALQADYALLYVPDSSGQLILLNAYIAEQEPPAKLNEWPPIRPHEYEAMAFTSLQPILVELDQLPTGNSQYTLLPTWSSAKSVPITARLVQSGRITSGRLRRRIHSLREALVQRFVYTTILAPLITRDEPLGLLVLARSVRPETREKKSFTIVDLSQAQDFAEQAAIAFTNAQVYQQLRDAHRRQQELDQLKDQFMITASHELRTPLTAVQGYLELIAQYDEIIPASQRQEFLQKARRGCDELVLLLGNVMDASRLDIESGIRPANFEQLPVKEVIQSVIDLIEPQLTQEKRELYLNIPAHLLVRADPGRLRQVFLNLSINALKYSSPGTPIAFTAHAISDVGPAVVIRVIDKGKGIPPRDQASLFQRFVRLERDMNSTVRGSGLGLYISRRLIEAMNGKIGVESSGIEGAGSAFFIQLPMQ